MSAFIIHVMLELMEDTRHVLLEVVDFHEVTLTADQTDRLNDLIIQLCVMVHFLSGHHQPQVLHDNT